MCRSNDPGYIPEPQHDPEIEKRLIESGCCREITGLDSQGRIDTEYMESHDVRDFLPNGYVINLAEDGNSGKYKAIIEQRQ